MASEYANEKLYRYMDFTKFCDFIFKRKLYFSRADQQNDDLGGQIAKVDQLQRKYIHREEENGNRILTKEEFHRLQKKFLINCWCRDSLESFAMWKIYTADTLGVAVETTDDLLMHSFIFQDEDILSKIDVEDWGPEIFISNCMKHENVKYIDYDTDSVNAHDDLWTYRRFFYKRRNFSYENEYRLLIDGERLLYFIRGTKEAKGTDPRKKEEFDNVITDEGFVQTGELLSVDINKLVKQIIVCPNAQAWFVDLVKIVLDKAGFGNITVISSELSKEPYL